MGCNLLCLLYLTGHSVFKAHVLLLMAGSSPIVSRDHSFIIHSSVDGPLLVSAFGCCE